jgi:hypothetical protein
LADHGKKEEAKNMLRKCDKNMLEENFSYGMVSRYQQHDYFSMQFILACYKAGDIELADKVSRIVKKDLKQQMDYYAAMGEMSSQEFEQGLNRSLQFRYQHERDAFLDGLSHRLRPLYDDAERGYQIMKQIESMEAEFKKPKIELNEKPQTVGNKPAATDSPAH